MIGIEFSNQTRSAVNPEPLRSAIAAVLSKHGITDNVDVELKIVGRLAMRRLNARYRQKDYPTDVLSFPIWDNLEAIRQQSGRVLLGSIVICLPVAIADAKRENQTIQDKLAFLTEHSVLHLLGFHHEGD